MNKEDSRTLEEADQAIGSRVSAAAPMVTRSARVERVTREQAAILEAVRNGLADEEAVLRQARATLGYQRLGKNVRVSLVEAANDLVHRGLLAIEDREYFPTAQGRSAALQVMTISNSG